MFLVPWEIEGGRSELRTKQICLTRHDGGKSSQGLSCHLVELSLVSPNTLFNVVLVDSVSFCFLKYRAYAVSDS